MSTPRGPELTAEMRAAVLDELEQFVSYETEEEREQLLRDGIPCQLWPLCEYSAVAFIGEYAYCAEHTENSDPHALKEQRDLARELVVELLNFIDGIGVADFGEYVTLGTALKERARKAADEWTAKKSA